MPFLPPNQQRQSTEGTMHSIIYCWRMTNYSIVLKITTDYKTAQYAHYTEILAQNIPLPPNKHLSVKYIKQ